MVPESTLSPSQSGFPEWLENSIVSNFAKIAEIRVGAERQVKKRQMSKTIQNTYYENIFLSESLHLEREVYRRTERWRNLVVTELLHADKLQEVCKDLSKLVAPCVINCFLKSVFNGWATHRRLSLPTRSCVFGCDIFADELEHYFGCSVIWEAAHKISTLAPFPLSKQRAMIFQPLNTVSPHLLVLHNFAAQGAFVQCSRNPSPGFASICQMYRERLRKAAVLHRSTAKLLRDIGVC